MSLKKIRIKRKYSFYLSPILFLMLAVSFVFGYIVDALSYLFAVVMHELCHAALASALGYSLNQFKLMPYGAGLTGDFEGASPRDEIKIALVGPFSNIVAAITFTALWWIFPSSYVFTQIFVWANIFTAIINLLPIFPLDGGRALLAFLSIRNNRGKVYAKMRIFGMIFAVIMCTMSVIAYGKFNFSFFMMGVFIFFSTLFPDKRCKYERLYSMAFRRKKIKRGLAVREIIVFEDMSIYELIKLLNGSVYTRFVLVDENMRKTGEITETQLELLSGKTEHNISIKQAKNLLNLK